ncbi:two-component regulator propeller domain-containing protein, partial [Flavihumibacter sp. CACIAM 22H1]|uniref:ligand-binding sensor domain-containing protein n=1 Tax=Flavihumibacter sp. CACIAM 22H1 TaxID=1812911 RepID=UPI0007A81C2E
MPNSKNLFRKLTESRNYVAVVIITCMPKRAHAYFFVAYVFCSLLQAQLVFSQSYYFKNYQVQQGLSGNTITSILQDRKGFMWFGTRNGLNRFDGTHFRIFSEDAANPTSIGSNSILSLFEDRQETIWVGTYKGIYLYDAATEQFRAFTKIPRAEVRHIKGDSANTIWIISNFQLYRYNLATDDLRSYQANNMQSIALHVSKEGTVYVATTTGLIKVYNPQKDQFETYDIATIYGQSITYVQDLHPVNDSLLLIGTMNKVLLLNRKKSTIQNIFEGSRYTGTIQVHSILRQGGSSFWLGTETGIYIWDVSLGIRQHIEKHFTNPYSISDNVINVFCRDREDGIWIGTFFGGVNYYSESLSSFQKYSPINGENNLSGNLVHEICRDDAGFIWIGTEDAGLNKLDPLTGKIKQFMPGMGAGSIAYQNIHGLVAAGNELWIGTYEHGLDVMDLRTEKVIRHYKDGAGKHDLKGNFIVALHRTAAGEILVGTWNGLFRYNRDTDNFTQLPFFNTQIQAIYEDDAGTIWACTYGNGVYYYNTKTDKGGRLLHDSLNKESIPNNYVNNLYEDRKKNIWFSTETGICRYQPLTGKITRYTDGYLNNQTFRILEDSSGQFWISTAKGLVRLDPVSSQTKQYNTANGLLSDQFNYNSAYRSPEGDMYFGTVKGMIRFKPETLPKNNFIPPVFITGILVNNQARIFAATEQGTMVLPYDSSSISIDMAALSYRLPEMNEYAYKMEGVDKDWIYIKTNRRIYYTKLSPGNYRFLLKGSNSGEVWNDNITQLRITILPPFWASTWAYLLYVLVTLGITGLIIRYYYLAWTEKNRRKMDAMEMAKEREIYNAKIEFFTNVAHEIRTPLTMIKLPLDKLLQATSNHSSITESLLTMKKNTNRLIDLTDQLLDFRKAEANHFSLNFISTDITGLLKEVVSGF